MLFKKTSTLLSRSMASLPKRPSNPYNIFIADRFAAARASPDTPAKEVMVALSSTWRDMTPAQKRTYTKQAEQSRQRYEEFFRTVPLSVLEDLGDKKEREKLRKKLVDIGRLPKKPPMSGYQLFQSRERRDPALSVTENMSAIAAKYQMLSEVKKERLRAEAEKLKEQYRNEYDRLLGK